MRVIRASENRRVRWKNDGGWTTEIARDPADGEHFRWRISIAEIERDGPFSAFPGIDRELLLLDGSGIELDIDDAPPRRLVQRFERVRFAGESHVDCRLLAGPTRDFNVMADRALVRAETFARPLVGPMVIFPEAGVEWFAYVFAGHADARDDAQTIALAAGDGLHVDFRAGGARIVIDGGGELVLVKFSAAA